MPWFIPAAISLASGIASAVSASSAADAQNERIREAQKLMRESLIDDTELQNLLNANKKSWNSKLTSTLNTNALRTRGVANSSVVAGAVAGGIEGAALQSESNIRTKVIDRNSQIEQNMAQLALGQASSNPLGDFVSGGISGLTAGLEFNKFLDHVPTDPTTIGQTDGTSTNGVPGTGMNNFNYSDLQPQKQDPFIPKPVNPYGTWLGQDQYNKSRVVDYSSFFN